MYDVYVKLLKLPHKVKGVTVDDSDGAYLVFINSEISEDEQKNALMHELNHIKCSHFYSALPLYLKEREAEKQNSIKIFSDNNLLLLG